MRKKIDGYHKTNTVIKGNLSENLFYLEAKNKITREDLNEAGIKPKSYENWKRGNSSPDLSNAVKLARFFNVSLDDLVLTRIRKETEPIQRVET